MRYASFKKFVEEKKREPETLVNSGEFLLFFKYHKDIFGADENSRVVFARMKNPDKEDISNWEKEASFTAKNLSKFVKGEDLSLVLRYENLKDLKVITPEKATQELKKISSRSNDGRS